MGSDFPFGGMFGDPEDLQRNLQEMMEQMQGAQKVAWADNAINLAVQMTVACIQRLDLGGAPEDQATQVRDARVLRRRQSRNGSGFQCGNGPSSPHVRSIW